jgi:hypothetical protein
MQSPYRCELCIDNTTLSVWLTVQCDTMLCFSRFTYALLRAILRLSWYSISWVRSILACACQCSLHADVNCLLTVLQYPFEWKHTATLCSASQDSLMPYSEPYSGCLDTQQFEYVVSWLVHLNTVSMQVKLCLDSIKLSLHLEAQCDTMLCFSRFTYAILRPSWYSIFWVRSILASASQCSLHTDVSCTLTTLHSPFDWQCSATPCSASQDSLMPYSEPYSGCLDTWYLEYVVSWLAHVNAVSMQMSTVSWQYYNIPLRESTLRHYALLLKTHLCHTQSNTQAVLILNTLST